MNRHERSDRDPGAGRPTHEQCSFVPRAVAVEQRHGLSVIPTEHDAHRPMLTSDSSRAADAARLGFTDPGFPWRVTSRGTGEGRLRPSDEAVGSGPGPCDRRPEIRSTTPATGAPAPNRASTCGDPTDEGPSPATPVADLAVSGSSHLRPPSGVRNVTRPRTGPDRAARHLRSGRGTNPSGEL